MSEHSKAMNCFKAINCYILAGGKNYQDDFTPSGELTKLEAGYRRYAKIFEKVKLVIKKEQAREHYLNYPHVLDKNEQRDFTIGIETALFDAESDAVFIGSSDILDFPLEWPVNLIKEYQGEPFLGYLVPDKKNHGKNHLFGIYSKKVLKELVEKSKSGDSGVLEFLIDSGRLLPTPTVR